MRKLYEAALAATFAPIGMHPLRTAYIRIGSLAALAISMSYMLGQELRGIPLASAAGPLPLVLSACFATQIAVLCVLLAAAGLSRRIYQDVFARWLLTLPISRSQRWLVLMLPSLILAGLALILTSWPLVTTYEQLGLHPLLLGGACALGALSALGLRHGLPERLAVTKLLLLPLILWSEHKLTGIVASNTASGSDATVAALAFIALQFLFVWQLIQSSRYTQAAITHSQLAKPVSGSFLPAATWCIKKLLRTAHFRLNFIVALVMNSLAVLIAHRYGLDASTAALFVGVSAAACLADIRALTPRLAPAEIAALRGSTRFGAAQLIAAGVCTAILAAPLLSLHNTANGLLVMSLLLASTATGLAAGTLLTPQPRDISSQFVSTLFCIGTIVIIPVLPFLPAGVAGQTVFYVACALLLLSLSFWLERSRNPFIWRKKLYA